MTPARARGADAGGGRRRAREGALWAALAVGAAVALLMTLPVSPITPAAERRAEALLLRLAGDAPKGADRGSPKADNATPGADVVIAAIDDAALQRFGRWSTWPRARLAGVVRALSDAGARTIALDVLLVDEGEPADDAALAAALRGHDRTAIARSEAPPLGLFAQAAAEIGSASATVGGAASGGVMIDAPSVGPTGTPALGLVAAAMHTDTAVDMLARELRATAGRVTLAWTARPGRTNDEPAHPEPRWATAHPAFSIALPASIAELDAQLREAASVLANRPIELPMSDAVRRTIDDEAAFLAGDMEASELDAALTEARTRAASGDAEAARELAVLRAVRTWRERPELERELAALQAELARRVDGRLVLVGWMATGAMDFVPTPLGERTPGVVVHAQLAQAAIDGRALARPVLPVRLGWALMLAACGGLIGVRLSARIGWMAAVGVAAVAVGVSAMALIGVGIGGRWLLAPTPGIAALGAAWAAGTAGRAALLQRERALVRRQLGARVSPQVAARLIDEPELVNVAGERRDVTVAMLDLGGFTAASQKLGPARSVELLNRTLGPAARALLADGACVDKFLGDGILAFWGAPEPMDDHALRAVIGVLHATAAHDASSTAQGLTRDGLPVLPMRAALASGEVIAGDCGAPPTLSAYTVIGPPVNLASRLVDAASKLGLALVTDEPTARAARRLERTRVLPIGPMRLKGVADAVETFAVVERDAVRDADAERLDAAVDAAQRGALDDARPLFDALRGSEAAAVQRIADAWSAALATAPAGEPAAIDLR